MNAEKLNQLKMALTEHRNLVVDFGNGLVEKLYFDEKINHYRGKEIGIWSMRLLVEIAQGKVKNTNLKEA